MELAPKTLSISPSHLFLNPNPKPPLFKFHINSPRSFIVCKSTEINAESYPSSTEPDGLWPSSPTRGDVFLHRHQSSAASASVLSEMKNKEKNNKDKTSSFTVHSCYGCGAPLQITLNPNLMTWYQLINKVINLFGTLLTPPTGMMKAENWAGLEAKLELQLRYQDIERQFLKSSDPSEVEESGLIALNVHLPKPVEIFVRPPLPVGDAGGQWYQYNDLTEKEEEPRPKWYF